MNLQPIAAAWALPEPVQFRPIDLGFFNLASYVDTPGGTYVLRLFQGTGGRSPWPCPPPIPPRPAKPPWRWMVATPPSCPACREPTRMWLT